MDVSLSIPSFSVTGIVSPFGILRDSIALPGEVIEAMGESIAELRTQFPSTMLVGPPTSLAFAVDEGAGFSLPQEAILTNNGVFGSLLGVTLTSSVAYVAVSPALLGNLASNETGTFDVTVDSTDLLVADSPYSASITIQDPRATNTPQTLPVSIVVRPKATLSIDLETLAFTAVKPLSGLFPEILAQSFIIENTGPEGSVLEWQLQRICCESWLVSFLPVFGVLASGESEVITVSVAPVASTVRGTYTETLRVTGYSTNQSMDVRVQMSIT